MPRDFTLRRAKKLRDRTRDAIRDAVGANAKTVTIVMSIPDAVLYERGQCSLIDHYEPGEPLRIWHRNLKAEKKKAKAA